jgi:hypothetical protein
LNYKKGVIQMAKRIRSVEVIHGHEDGPNVYGLGNAITFDGPVVDDIIEVNGVFFFYDKEDNLLMEIRHCPVVVDYQMESEE